MQLAIAYANLGQISAAGSCLDEATAAIEVVGEKWVEAEAYRIAGEIELKASDPDPSRAEEYFERAIEIARAQQARSGSFARRQVSRGLWRDQGRREKGRDPLAPFFGWFTEGFDTQDLIEARKLLAELTW